MQVLREDDLTYGHDLAKWSSAAAFTALPKYDYFIRQQRCCRVAFMMEVGSHDSQNIIESSLCTTDWRYRGEG